jgi:hypothetical protein
METVVPQSAPQPQPAPSLPRPRSITKPQLITGVAGFILLLASLGGGVSSGIARAKSLDTYRSVNTLNQALTYYFQDQNQYPTAEQFNNQQILTLNYLNVMPVPTDASGTCANQSQFAYSRPTQQTFSMQFCLSQGVNGLSGGLHTLTNNSLK